MPQQPNVLLIVSDQHNAKCLGAAGHPIVKTPHLDGLAAEGVRFTNAVAQNPICTPSRMCFLSGQYASNHGYYGLGGPFPQSLPTILGHFRGHGYRTAAIGKTHCPGEWVRDDCDYWRGASVESDHPVGTALSHYDRYLEAKGLLGERDDALYPEQSRKDYQSKDARCSRLSFEDSVEGWCVQEAQRFIAKSGDQPWLMQVGLERPHQLYSPSKPFWEMYPNDLPMPPNADIDMSLKPPHMRKMREMCESTAQEESLFGEKTYEALRRRKLRGYYGLVSQTDHAVGELLGFLRDRGLEQDTVVIYSTDHGEYACEFGLLEKAPGICGDAVTRIPFIWSVPGKARTGHVCDRSVETVDLATTIAALTGLPELTTGDGRDLTPLLQGEDIELHRVGVTENLWSKSVRQGPWRLVYYPDGMFGPDTVGELYNLDEDPWEMKNLFYDPTHQPMIMKLKEELLNWLVTTARAVTVHPPGTVPFGAGAVSEKQVRDLCRQGLVNYL